MASTWTGETRGSIVCENSVDASQPAPHNLPGTLAEIVMPTKDFADVLLWPVLVLIAHLTV